MMMVKVCALFLLVSVAAALSWESGVNVNFEGKSSSEIKRLMGWKKNPNAPRLPVVQHELEAIPDSFDAREKWANCTSIGTIQNQADCGSCWAFGAVESITDRFCIHKGNDTQLSFQDMTSCDPNDDGCDGGDPVTAWAYAGKTGLVSAECYEYIIPTCPPEQQPCLNFVNTPTCANSCVNDTSINWEADKKKVATAYTVAPKNKGIESEIIKNGPVEACFEVYEDFLTYKSGVYQHVNGSALGGHCVKLIGYGVDAASSLPYWLVANSWTTYWGNNGYFWILRGSNECGIESEVVAGLP